MSDLAKHLREIASGTVSVDYGDLRAYCDKTADEIERLEAELAEARRERDRLREAGHALLACPHIAERDMEPAWAEPESEEAIAEMRAAIDAAMRGER